MRLAAPNFTRSRAFLAMVEASPDLIAVLDAGGRRLYANPALCSLLPAAVALTGSDSFSHIHPDDRSAVRKLFMRVLTDRQGATPVTASSTATAACAASNCVPFVQDEATGSPRLMVVSRESPAAA